MLTQTARGPASAAFHHRAFKRGVSPVASHVGPANFNKHLAHTSSVGCLILQGQKLITQHPHASITRKSSISVLAHQHTNGSGPGTRIALGVALVLAAGTASALFFTKGMSLRDAADTVTQTVNAFGVWGPVIFVAAFVIATLLMIPATALTLAAGFLFGPAKGTAIVILAATLGAAAAFLVSRYLAKDFAKSKLQSYPRLKAVEEQVSQDGIKIVLLLRLAPLVPFTILNYALGVTDVSFVSYTVATAMGKLPGVFSQVYVGSTGRTAEAGSSASSTSSGVNLALTVIGVLSSVLVTKVIADKASSVLRAYDHNLNTSADSNPGKE